MVNIKCPCTSYSVGQQALELTALGKIYALNYCYYNEQIFIMLEIMLIKCKNKNNCYYYPVVEIKSKIVLKRK